MENRKSGVTSVCPDGVMRNATADRYGEIDRGKRQAAVEMS